MSSSQIRVSILALLVLLSGTAYSQAFMIDPNFQIGTGFGNGAGGFGITDMRIQDDKKIVVVGLFGSYNGTTVKNIARLNANGTLDNTFATAGTGFDASIGAVVIQTDGKIVVGGAFTSYNGISRKGVLRLNSNGSLDETFDAGTEITSTRSIALQTDGKILVGGSVNTSTSTFVKRLMPTGAIDPSFTIPVIKTTGGVPSVIVTSMVIQDDSKIIVGGFFNEVNGVLKNGGIFRLNENGTDDSAFPEANSSLSYPVSEIVIDDSGRIIFGAFGGVRRLTATGAIDNTFQQDNSNVFNGTALAVRGDKILEGVIGVTGGSRFFQVKSNGGLDTDENISSNVDSNIETIRIQEDGKILISGNFSTVGLTSSRGLVRLIPLAGQSVFFEDPGTKTFGDPAFELTAVSSIGGQIIFSSSNTSVVTISGNIATIVGAGTTTLIAQVPADETHSAGQSNRELVVSQGSNTITVDAVAAKTLGDAPFNIVATSSSGLAVTLTTSSDKITMSANQVTILKPGKATVNANQAGNANIKAAVEKPIVFCINPPKPIITSSGEGGAQVTLTSSNDSGNQWRMNGTIIPGSTAKTIQVSETGSYTVVTTIEECSSAASDAKVVAINGLEDSATLGLKIVQNPVVGQIVLEVSSEVDHEVNIEVVDMLGRMIASKQVRSNTISTVDIAHVADGIHVIRASSPYVNLTARILKKN